MLFLDMEEAFDRVSHEYLMKALKSAVIGIRMRLSLDVIYDADGQIRRTAVVNGLTSREFRIRAEVA